MSLLIVKGLLDRIGQTVIEEASEAFSNGIVDILAYPLLAGVIQRLDFAVGINRYNLLQDGIEYDFELFTAIDQLLLNLHITFFH